MSVCREAAERELTAALTSLEGSQDSEITQEGSQMLADWQAVSGSSKYLKQQLRAQVSVS